MHIGRLKDYCLLKNFSAVTIIKREINTVLLFTSALAGFVHIASIMLTFFSKPEKENRFCLFLQCAFDFEPNVLTQRIKK